MNQVAQLLFDEGKEVGRREGREEIRREAREEEIRILIDSLRSFAIPDEQIRGKLMEKYQLTKSETDVFLKNL